jgi:hypothetical protein
MADDCSGVAERMCGAQAGEFSVRRSRERIEVPVHGGPRDRTFCPADILGQRRDLRGGADVPRERVERQADVFGIALPYAERLDVDQDDLVEVIAQPRTGVLGAGVEQRRPPADADPVDDVRNGQTRIARGDLGIEEDRFQRRLPCGVT